MILIKFIFISLLTSQVTGASLLERLLDSAIKSTMCEARCGGLEDAEDTQVSFEVCEMVTRNLGTASAEWPLCEQKPARLGVARLLMPETSD